MIFFPPFNMSIGMHSSCAISWCRDKGSFIDLNVQLHVHKQQVV